MIVQLSFRYLFIILRKSLKKKKKKRIHVYIYIFKSQQMESIEVKPLKTIVSPSLLACDFGMYISKIYLYLCFKIKV